MSSSAPQPNERRILVADDDRDFAELLQELLQEEGYLVELVHNGNDVLDRLAAGDEPHVLLLDMRMPGLDGPEVLEQLHERGIGAGTRVIAMSAFIAAPDRQRIIDAGAVAILSKPVALDEILRVIREHASPEDLS